MQFQGLLIRPDLWVRTSAASREVSVNVPTAASERCLLLMMLGVKYLILWNIPSQKPHWCLPAGRFFSSGFCLKGTRWKHLQDLHSCFTHEVMV